MASNDSKRSASGDERNTPFGFPERLLDHGPGFDEGAAQDLAASDGGNDRLRASKGNAIPQQALAARIANAQKGGS